MTSDSKRRQRVRRASHPTVIVGNGQPIVGFASPADDYGDERPPATVAARWPEGGTPRREISDTRVGFMHRIVLGNLVGQWAGYQGIATLRVRDVVYRACTAFYDGALPIECVFTTRVLR